MRSNDTTPSLSVVVPVYNRRNLVMETLHSIALQKGEHFDLIVVDNGSTDGSYELLQSELSRLAHDGMSVRLLRQETPGACRARNTGLDAVETRWTMFSTVTT